MIAIRALFATVWPNVGPIESLEKLLPTPNRSSSAERTSCRPCPAAAVGVEIWKTLLPSSLFGDLLDLRVGVAGAGITERTGVLVRRLLEARRDPRARLEVDAEVQALAADRQRADQQDHAGHREEPPRRAHEVEAPALALLARRRARRAREIMRERPIVPRIACVASTAVNSETSVPMPSVKAKPLTPAVARMKRMNAVISVTTFASMIADEALLVAGAMPRGSTCPRVSPP